MSYCDPASRPLTACEQAAISHLSILAGFDIEWHYRHGDIHWKLRVEDFIAGAKWSEKAGETPRPKRVYIAHPIGGDVPGNVAKVKSIMKQVLDSGFNVMPLAPYLTMLELLNDEDPADRQRGMNSNKAYFDKRFIDELWVCGEHSAGVRLEIAWARENGIPVIKKGDWT